MIMGRGLLGCQRYRFGAPRLPKLKNRSSSSRLPRTHGNAPAQIWKREIHPSVTTKGVMKQCKECLILLNF
jgi:hypothetical protein